MAWILPTMANTRISIWHQMGRKLLGISVSLSLSLCLSISVFLSHTHAHTYTHSCSENSSVVDRNTEHSRTGSPTLRRSRKTAQLLHEKSTPTANKQPLQSAVDSASIIWHLVRGSQEAETVGALTLPSDCALPYGPEGRETTIWSLGRDDKN